MNPYRTDQRENPIVQFIKINDIWHLKTEDLDPVEVKTLDFNIKLYTTLGYIDPISKIVWDYDELCFYFEGSDEIFNLREFKSNTDTKTALESIQDIALGSMVRMDDQNGQKFAELFFDFSDEEE